MVGAPLQRKGIRPTGDGPPAATSLNLEAMSLAITRTVTPELTFPCNSGQRQRSRRSGHRLPASRAFTMIHLKGKPRERQRCQPPTLPCHPGWQATRADRHTAGDTHFVLQCPLRHML